MRRPRSKPIPVGDLIARFLSKREGTKRTREALALKVFDAFRRIGPPITDFAEPAFYRKGTLTLTVSNSAWMTELSLLSNQVLERLNKRLGRAVVKTLRLRLGNLKLQADPPPKPRPLTPKQQEDVAHWAALISDPVVRAAMIEAATMALANGPPPGAAPSGPPGPRAPAPTPPPEPPRPRYGYGFSPKRDRWKDR